MITVFFSKSNKKYAKTSAETDVFELLLTFVRFLIPDTAGTELPDRGK